MSSTPRVAVSAFTRYHLYQLARALSGEGVLTAGFCADLVTPPKELSSYFTMYPLALRLLAKGVGRFPITAGCSALFWRDFDSRVARSLERLHSDDKCNTLQCWSLYSLEQLKVARRLGIRSFLERSCPHIDEQIQLMQEEADRLGIQSTSALLPYTAYASRMREEYELADYITTCSEFSRRSFIERGFDPQRVIAVHAGSNFRSVSVERDPTSTFRLLCVGTHPLRKGVAYLIRAWQKLNLPHGELVLRTPLLPEIQRLITSDSIRVLPALSRADLEAEYRRASAFCLPSVDDGFGMVVLEAMSFGLPVIVSSSTGAAEILASDDDALIFPVRDEEALGRCITKLYENRDLAIEMGRRGQTTATAYSWQRFAKIIVAAYQAGLATR